jgi:D-threo-aldose 1-dehydrogenase
MATAAGQDRTSSPLFGREVLGGAAFAGLYQSVDPDTVRAALQAAWDLGIRSFDTAPHYGVGLSEERVGGFLADQPRDAFVLSTKVGRLLVDDPDAATEDQGFFGTPRRRRVPDYSADGVRRSIEDSLRRLGLDRIDLVLIHDPEDHLDAAVHEAAPALSQLRAEGVIGGYGVGTNYADVALRLVVETDLDHVLIAGRYTLLDRRAASPLLGACVDRGVAVLAAGLLNSGLLADPYGPDPHFDYQPATPAVVTLARQLDDACRGHGVPLRAAALQFPLRHPAVSSVVLGAGTADQVRDCHEQLSTEIPEALWGELDELVAVSPDAGT